VENRPVVGHLDDWGHTLCFLCVVVVVANLMLTLFVLKFPGNWEIPFELISDLSWLGSGAQGAVFLGRLNVEPVAVKKVRNANETDILHLRKLSHPNIIKFKLVNFGIIILTIINSTKEVMRPPWFGYMQNF